MADEVEWGHIRSAGPASSVDMFAFVSEGVTDLCAHTAR